MNQWEGVVVVSYEGLFSVPTDVINEILDTFSTSRIEILVTCRSLYELVISQWQESIKAGDTISLKTYADEVAQGPKNTTNSSLIFWITADLATPIKRWSQSVGIENVTVQCVDTSQPEVTLRIFEQINEIPSGLLGTGSQSSINQSMTYSEAELIRSCNEMLFEGSVSNHLYSIMTPDVRRKILSKIPHVDDSKIELPTSYYESIAAFVNSEVQLIVNSGARITGDVSLLTRIPQGFSDSRNSDINFDKDVIETILRQSLLDS